MNICTKAMCYSSLYRWQRFSGGENRHKQSWVAPKDRYIFNLQDFNFMALSTSRFMSLLFQGSWNRKFLMGSNPIGATFYLWEVRISASSSDFHSEKRGSIPLLPASKQTRSFWCSVTRTNDLIVHETNNLYTTQYGS